MGDSIWVMYDFPAFAPAFERGPLEVGAYMVLLNLSHDEADAIRIVAACYQAAEDKNGEVENLLLSDLDRQWRQGQVLGWRQQLVGCVALLVAEPPDRPLEALVKAACDHSWVSPQILVTASLADPSDWESRVEASILEREDAKAAAALVSIIPGSSAVSRALPTKDLERGDAIAQSWRGRITSAFDAAGIDRTW